MNFRNKFRLRDYSLRATYWFFSITSLLSAYTFIKWQKAMNYTEWLFTGVNTGIAAHREWIVDNYLDVLGVSIYWCFFMAIMMDLVLRRFLIKRVVY